MRLFPLAATILLAGCAVPAARLAHDSTTPATAYDTSWVVSKTLQPGSFALLPPEVARVPSPVGGSGVQVAVVRPDVPAGTRVPVIAIASPYYPPLRAESIPAEDFTLLTDYAQGMYLLFAKRFVPHGYAVALVAVRGTSGSGGCMDLSGAAERADVDAAISWLGEQPWSSGSVGMVGGSYDGTTQWGAAAAGNPHLKTIVPLAAVSDLFSLLYANGTVDSRGTGAALLTYYHYGFLDANPANGRPPADVADAALCPDAWRGFASHAQASATGVRDAWWADRNARPGVEARYHGSIFLVHGFLDRVVDPAQAHPWADGLATKEWLGQWPHAWPDQPGLGENARRWDWAETLLRWFDQELKGAKTDTGARVEVQDDAGAWRREASWPPADATPRAFHLASSGKLADDATSAPATVPLCEDPLDGAIETPEAACLAQRFESAPFAAGLRFAGSPTLHVSVTPQGPGGGLAARLYVVGDGAPRLVGRAQMDLRFADGGEAPRDVTPGARIVARMQLDPLDVVVPPGARLALVLKEGALEERFPSVPDAPLSVDVGGDASALTVRTFVRGPEAFFSPPS